MSTVTAARKKIARIGDLLGHGIKDKSVILRSEPGALMLSCPQAHVLRVRSSRSGSFDEGEGPEDRSFAAVADKSGKIEPEAADHPEKLELEFDGIRVLVARSPLRMLVYDREGAELYRDHPQTGFGWLPSGVMATLLIRPGMRFHGFGEKTGPLDKSGRAMTMWNTDRAYPRDYDPIYMSIPMCITMREGRAAGMFFDNPCFSRFDAGKSRPELFSYTALAGELDLYIIEGPAVSEVVERFTGLAGRMPMPPRWSLGFHQSRWSYKDEGEVRGIAQRFRQEDVPCDSIHLDIGHMDRYRVFTFDPARFPDPKGLSKEMRGKGFKLVALVDPGVSAEHDFDLYVEGRDKDYFCNGEDGKEYNAQVWPRKVAFPDFSRPEVIDWWAEKQKRLADAGIEGAWNDMNEPSCWKRSIRFKDCVLPLRHIRKPRMVHDDEGRKTPHLCFRNVYGMMMARASRQGLAKSRPGRRPFLLTRAGYAGVQRYSYVWNGDNASSFFGLARSIPMLANLGLSGVGMAGPDIGGFKGDCTGELFARWIELGAFYPFCRSHTAIRTRRQEPWSFGPEIKEIARNYIKLRYRLHPTLYTLIRRCCLTGAPVLRPLFYEFQDDPAAAGIEDQVMSGPWIMLAPVLQKGARSRNLYLPECGWTDFWTGEKIRGPATIGREAPLDLLPAYVREGAVLFSWPALDHLDQHYPEQLFVDLYPPSAGYSREVLYEDDGETEEYLKGAFSERGFSQERAGQELRIRMEEKRGEFEPPARRLIMRVRLHGRPQGVQLDGRALEPGPREQDTGLQEGVECGYDLSVRTLRVSLADDGGGHLIKIRV